MDRLACRYRPRLHDGGRADRGTDRQAPAQRLPDHEQIRHHVLVLAGEPAPCPAAAGVYLIQDQQDVLAVAALAQPREEAGRRYVEPAPPEDRLDEDRADRVRGELCVPDDAIEGFEDGPGAGDRVGREAHALKDEYFVERQLYPNVDFYSGIIYRAIGIPTEMFTVMFAMGRLPGWIAQWKEMIERGEPIGRPRQIYDGANIRDFVPMDKR